MKFYLFIICFWSYLFGAAQFNLVPNSSFEIVPNCTEFSYNIYAAPPWVNPTEYGSPDLMNHCNGSVSWFINQYQQPHSGLGYAGIFSVLYDVPNFSDIREYIQVQLSDSLHANHFYKVEYYLSLHEWSKYGTNNIGVYFSDSAIYQSGMSYDSVLLEYPAQIKPFNNPILTDTINWMRIEAVYESMGGEKFITIGNFNTDSETDTFAISQQLNTAENREASYYVIDDITVKPIDSLPGGFPANAGPDQTIYIQDSVFIGQKIANLNCNWYELGGNQIASNTSGLYVQPQQTTTYVVEQILGTDITYDTCTVFVEGLGVDEKQAVNFNLYPNPASQTFRVVSKQGMIQKIELLSLTGNVLQTTIVHDKMVNIPIENLSHGIYLIKIYATDGIAMKQLVVE